MTRITSRKWIRFLVAMGLLAAVDGTRAARQTIKLTTLAPKGSSYHKSLERMGQAWREISGGGVELVIYAGGIQGGEAAMVDRMAVGQAHAGLLTAVGLESIEPAVSGLQSIPMMYRNLDELDHVAGQLQPELERRMRDRGFVVLAWVDTGWVRFFSRTPVRRVDDLRRLKLFAWAGNPETVKVMNEAGLRPVPLETADILTGLETGLIDAVPTPPYYALTSQIYRPAPHMLDVNWAPLVGALVVTRRAWERIPEDIRPQLAAVAREAGSEIKAAGRREGERSVETMREKWGLTVHAATPEIEAEWRTAAEKAYPTIRGGIVPEQMFDDVRRLLDEYRTAERAEP